MLGGGQARSVGRGPAILFCAFSIVLLASPPPSAEEFSLWQEETLDLGRGLTFTRNQSSLYVMVMSPQPASGIPIGKGGITFRPQFMISSSYHRDLGPEHATVADYEMVQGLLWGAVGLTDRLTLEAEVPYRHFTFSNARRLIHSGPEESRYIVLRGKERLLEVDSGEGGFGDTTLALTFNLNQPGNGGALFSLRFAAELPTGRERLGLSNGETDYQGALLITNRISDALVLTLNVGAVLPGDVGPLELAADPFGFLFGALEWDVTSRQSFHFQLLVHDRAIERIGLEGFDDQAAILTLGYKLKFRRAGRTALELGFHQDPVRNSFVAQPDVMASVGVTWKLR